VQGCTGEAGLDLGAWRVVGGGGEHGVVAGAGGAARCVGVGGLLGSDGGEVAGGDDLGLVADGCGGEAARPDERKVDDQTAEPQASGEWRRLLSNSHAPKAASNPRSK